MQPDSDAFPRTLASLAPTSFPRKSLEAELRSASPAIDVRQVIHVRIGGAGLAVGLLHEAAAEQLRITRQDLRVVAYVEVDDDVDFVANVGPSSATGTAANRVAAGVIQGIRRGIEPKVMVLQLHRAPLR